MEKWKDIIGYEGCYHVSTTGKVRNAKTKKQLSSAKIKSGYYTVSLWKNNIGKTFTVHRLVATAFLQNPYNKKCVDHIDGNKNNNNVNNLRWATTKENCNNPVSVERYKKSATGRIISEKTKEKHKVFMKGKTHNHIQVLCIETQILYNSMSSAARNIGVSEPAIRRAVDNINKTSGGFHWKKIGL